MSFVQYPTSVVLYSVIPHSFLIMLSLIRACGLLIGMAGAVAAGPVIGRSTDVVAIRSTDLEVYSAIEERFIPSISLGSYNLATSHVNEELLNM